MRTFFPFFALSFALALVEPAHANESLEEDLFGPATPAEPTASESKGSESKDSDPKGTERPASAPTTPTVSTTMNENTTAVGGRADWRLGLWRQGDEPLAQMKWSSSPAAFLFVDNRPRPDLRGYLRVSVTPSAAPSGVPLPGTPSAPGRGSDTGATVSLLELWVKWQPQGQGLFWTLGRQPIKLGSATIWNPTDFLAEETRNPFAFFDDRSGVDALRMNLPLEASNANMTFLVSSPRASESGGGAAAQATPRDLQLAARAEWSYSSTEVSSSFAWRESGSTRWGLDVSSGLGPVDLELEGACTARSRKSYFELETTPTGARRPVAVQRRQDCLAQLVAGLSWQLNYGNSDAVTLGAEYFWNGLGHDEPLLELAAALSGSAAPLSLGEEYLAAYVVLPTPGAWDDTTIQATFIKNFSDFSALYRVSVIQTIMEFSRISFGANARTGLGEFRLNEADLRTFREFSEIGETGPGTTSPGSAAALRALAATTPELSLDATLSVSL